MSRGRSRTSAVMLQRPPSLSPDLVKLRRRFPAVTGADWNAYILSFSRSLTLLFSRSLRVRPCRSLELRSCRARTQPPSAIRSEAARDARTLARNHTQTHCAQRAWRTFVLSQSRMFIFIFIRCSVLTASAQ